MLALVPGAAPRTDEIAALLDQGDVAAVVWRGVPPSGEVALVEGRGVAALLECGPEGPAGRVGGLDGVHAINLAALKPALSALKPDGIVGVGGLLTRHDAMTAGESGADYVLFGTLDAAPEDFPRALDLLAWWVELFEVPCVGVAASLEAVDALARAGADFILLAAPFVSGPEGPARVAEAQARIAAAAADGVAP